MGDTVRVMDITTLGTGLAGIGGVDHDDRHSRQGRLVGYKGPQLEEAPVVMSCPLPAPNCDSIPDTAQVFQGDTEGVPLRLVHDGLGDAMVGVPLIATLSPPYRLELTLGRTAPFPLQVAPPVSIDAPVPLHRLAGVDGALRVHRQVDNAQVNSEEALGGHNLTLWGVNGLMEKEPALKVDQLRLFCLSRKGNARPRLKGEAVAIEGDGAVNFVGMVVDGNGPQGIEAGQGVAPSLVSVGVGHFADGNCGLLARQAKLSPEPVIGSSLEGQPMEYAFLKGDGGEGVAGGIELDYHVLEAMMFSVQSHLDGQLHSLIIPQ